MNDAQKEGQHFRQMGNNFGRSANVQIQWMKTTIRLRGINN
jgi:hypothetical protein